MTIGFGRQGHSRDHHELVPASTGGLPYESAGGQDVEGFGGSNETSEHPRAFITGQMTYEMPISEIRSEQKLFAASCRLAVIAGFDVIEIHAPHGYLEHEFLFPSLTNGQICMGGMEKPKTFSQRGMLSRYGMPVLVLCLGVRISNQEYWKVV